ncbi:hypothetical protein EB061_00200 [bacterium]|jgi:hypothetical protein|nr:hypothetical protein [bacterium]
MKQNNPAGSRLESPMAATSVPAPLEEKTVQINGLEQIIEMLRHADPAFRSSLLKRLQARDPGLARKLARIL